MEKYFLFFFLIFFLSTASSIDFQASPEELDFYGAPKEKICNNITLQISEPSTILFQDKWAERNYNKRDLTKHKLESKSLNLEIEYLSNIEFNNSKELEICITAKDYGNFHGILLSRIKDQQTGIGVWLNLEIKQKPNLINTITSHTIKKDEQNSSQAAKLIIPILTIILLIQLIIFIRKKKQS